jgi:hypothetical protein
MVTASTEKYLDKAVAGALEFVKKRSDADPVRIVERSLELLTTLPRHGLVPVMPGSGLKPPRGKDGWVAGDWLLGWAWDREERDRILHVAVMRDSEPLLMVSADAVDRSLNEVPGRGMHAFRIPVLPEYFDGDRLNLEIWEGCAPVFRGGLFVDREGEPMLRRLRVNPTMVDNNDTSGKERRWMRRWIGKAFARTASTVRS